MMCDYTDEMKKEDTKKVKEFLDAYLALCKIHGCLILSDGEEVEVVPDQTMANAKDPWGVIRKTKSRGWEL